MDVVCVRVNKRFIFIVRAMKPFIQLSVFPIVSLLDYESSLPRIDQNLASTFPSVSCNAQALAFVLLRTDLHCSAVKPLASTAGL